MAQSAELNPVRISLDDYESLEKEIARLFRDEIYRPLMAELGSKEKLKNSADELLEAIQSGRLYFSRGYFRGKLNANLTRELKRAGATWDRKEQAFKLIASRHSRDLRHAISASASRFEAVLGKINKKLSDMLPAEIADKLSAQKLLDDALWKIDKSVSTSIKEVRVVPKMTDQRREKIAEDYSENLKKYIKDWTEEHILELRERIGESALSGMRYDGIVKMIQDSYGVSQRKAQFLARQETHLMLTAFKEARYAEAGVDKYKWCCVAGSPNHPVRHSHKVLDGKIFSFRDPPVTSPSGAKNNPGQDFNCRCFARPIVVF